ncbi:GNAT family N-acetyltransferase [Oxalobacteraceae bacterium R-40]|uniref:GNAT family N-acetyltransferase n=1 Tax=Keguizhuia sedimenti TaxID=3064264 RepID=A0ABU1BQB5_9BURK|nr:GNAT family N-acetyltransferase [Oxalobacteraceae bacterium R-40]
MKWSTSMVFPILKSNEFDEALLSSSCKRKPDIGDDFIITCENKVPPFMGKILDELYGSLFSSIPHLEVHESLRNADSYIAVKDNQVIAALLFKHDQHEIAVINEVFRIGKDEIAKFAGYIFSTYGSVKKIVFNEISSDVENLGYAVQRFPGTVYIIIALPPTEQAYTAMLGKATRKNIKHHLSRLRRAFPSFVHEVQEAGNILEEDLLSVIEFNRMRMAEKHKIVHLSQEDIARIIRLAKRCGFISLIRIDGRVCAGAICYQTGKTVTSHVNAHDPQYNQFRLGTLSCYLAVCESIRREAKEFNLEWGGEEYKYALLGADHPFERVLIYRSYMQMLSDTKNILQIRTSNRLRAAKMWLVNQSKKDSYFAKYLNSCIGMIKKKKYSHWLERRK